MIDSVDAHLRSSLLPNPFFTKETGSARWLKQVHSSVRKGIQDHKAEYSVNLFACLPLDKPSLDKLNKTPPLFHIFISVKTQNQPETSAFPLDILMQVRTNNNSQMQERVFYSQLKVLPYICSSLYYFPQLWRYGNERFQVRFYIPGDPVSPSSLPSSHAQGPGLLLHHPASASSFP